ncbi:MAG: hypothetical protein QOJ99_5326 [Bryobacterales bacterium]|nr:hypothetical protein [Bryobacterales bacterium]
MHADKARAGRQNAGKSADPARTQCAVLWLSHRLPDLLHGVFEFDSGEAFRSGGPRDCHCNGRRYAAQILDVRE